MSHHPSLTIEFINGPFDGHIERVRSNIEGLPHSIVCYVSENVFRLFDGQCRLPSSQFTSVAIYQRATRGERIVYQFTRAVAPQAMKIDSVVSLPRSRRGDTPGSSSH